MVFCKNCIKLEQCNKEAVCCSDGIAKDDQSKFKFANEIVDDMNKRGNIDVPENCITGEEFEKWLRERNK